MARRTKIGVGNFAAIDFETANYSRDSACAIGVAFVRDGCVVDVQRHLIRPPTREFCFTYLHGLTWKDVRKAPTFAKVWSELVPALTDLDFLAAHNAPFDHVVYSKLVARAMGCGNPNNRSSVPCRWLVSSGISIRQSFPTCAAVCAYR